ncbi:Predicted flavin reductase RutF in novel pyrimidine catabolism pathway [Klebsiella aerogenes]|nr:Predicted flavin reductase RutF in novel pyrimidine catabolism pathway [Klebsiella aerogenes]
MELTDKASFRDAMAHVGAAVNIITTDGPAGRAGFTASAVCSVTDTPPTLLVCLNRSASVWPVFSEHHTLCVNTLAAGQETLSTLFGVKRQWTSVLPPPTGRPAPPAVRGWRRLWSALTAASTSASASGRTTFCFVTSWPLPVTRSPGD